MHQEDFRGWDFSTEAFSSIFQFFLHFFFNSSHVRCRKASADKILDKQPAPCVAFSRRTLFINPPATDSDTPLRNSCQIENYLKFQFFHFWSNVQNSSNSCDGSIWRLGAKLLFCRQIATVSMAWYPAGCSWKFINPGIKTRAMASPLHNRAFWPKQNLGRCLRGALSPSAGGIIMKSQWNCYEIAQEFQLDGF